MSIYHSNGYPYIGIRLERGSDEVWPPTSWVRIKEVFEATELSRSWDHIDFTSHDTGLSGGDGFDYTRTSKPGLMAEGTFTFRGIWLPASHEHFEEKFVLRKVWPYQVTYDFTSETTPLRYDGLAWIGDYILSGDLGDKFVYSVTLVFEGILQPGTVSALPKDLAPIKMPSSSVSLGKKVPTKEVQK